MKNLSRSLNPVTSRNVSLILILTFVALLGIILFIWDSNEQRLHDLRATIDQNQLASRKMQLVNGLIEAARARTRITARIIYLEDPFEKDEMGLQLDVLASRFARLRNELLKLPLSDQEQDILQRQAKIVPTILPVQRQSVELAIQGDEESLRKAEQLLHEIVFPGQGKLVALFVDLINLQQANIDFLAADSHKTYEQARHENRLLVGTAVIFGVMLSAFVVVRVRSIQRTIADSRDQLEVAVGDRTRELAEAQSMLQTVLDTIPVRVFWKDSSGTYLGCNRLFARDAGLDGVARISGKRDRDLDWGNRKDHYHREDMQVIESGESRLDHEEPRLGSDGRETWWQVSKVPLTDNGNRIVGMLGSYHEITERKKAERALQSSEILLRTIVDSMVDGLFTIDHDGLIRSFNPAAEEIFDYRKDDIIGKPLSMLIPDYRAPGTGSRTQDSAEKDLTGLRRDQSEIPIELAIAEMHVGDAVMYTGIVRDITERKRIDHVKDELVSTVSHELRTPLTSIHGSIGLMLNGAVCKLPEQATELLDLANRNTRRLLALINDLLDMQKMESGKMPYDFGTVELHRLIGQAIEENRDYAGDYDIEFTIRDMEAVEVYADEHRMMQVMGNLLSNAAKFSPPGKQVEISVSREGDMACVTVRDYGRGIPLRFRDRLFERFTQADSSDSRQKGGTGLGLAITRAIIEKHRGRIWFETSEGEGTTFRFELPIAATAGATETRRTLAN